MAAPKNDSSKKIKREKKNFKLIFILSLIFKKSILQWPTSENKGSGSVIREDLRND